MESLVKVLLRVPGLNSQNISAGLKIPPFQVLSVEEEQQALSVKSALEKFGAICEIKDTNAAKAGFVSPAGKPNAPKKEDHKTTIIFCLAIVLLIILFSVGEFVLKDLNIAKQGKTTSTQKTAQRQTAGTTAGPAAQKSQASPAEPVPREEKMQEDYFRKDKNELKGDLSKNPYNSSAWKALHEKLLKEGDIASARRAKESYDKSVKAQMVMSSLANTFGNGVRVEITESAVYYRTNKDVSYQELYKEAEKLRDSVNARFPGKSMVLENYKPNNEVQVIKLKPAYRTDTPK